MASAASLRGFAQATPLQFESSGWLLANAGRAAKHILSEAAECLGGTHPHPP